MSNVAYVEFGKRRFTPANDVWQRQHARNVANFWIRCAAIVGAGIIAGVAMHTLGTFIFQVAFIAALGV